VRPITGTPTAWRTAADDEHLSAELLADGEERAEHVQIDLGRNDVDGHGTEPWP
jgi:anthranilate/para-aminobenzoate synthase component I